MLLPSALPCDASHSTHLSTATFSFLASCQPSGFLVARIFRQYHDHLSLAPITTINTCAYYHQSSPDSFARSITNSTARPCSTSSEAAPPSTPTTPRASRSQEGNQACGTACS
uniref:Uncharacterized protein n=1 Tax=Fusarium oxysporum (strain Fo5176) TaxID=660025 RepID=A0A0D2X8A2_FUSOF